MMVRLLWIAVFVATTLAASFAQSTVIFFEDHFPAADTAVPTRETLVAALPGAVFCDASQLSQSLADPQTRLVVLPFGSAFPESQWQSIVAYLQRGGNLLVLGGKPFTRAAFLQENAWHLRNDSVRFSRQLLINDYAQTSDAGSYSVVLNPEPGLDLPQLPTQRTFSATVRLSTKDLYPTEGSAGSLDARLDPLLWHDRNHAHIAAPAIAIDHLQSAFSGGRWVFLTAELSDRVINSKPGRQLVSELAAYATRGTEELSARPKQALYLPGEPVALLITATTKYPASIAALELTVIPDSTLSREPSQKLAATTQFISLPARSKPGLYRVEARFTDSAGRTLRIDHSAFWIRDDEMLHSGPRLTAGADFFQMDGKPAPILGTTYMSSDVQRQFLMQPNPAVWDRDMQQIADSGLNLIRTGLWSGWGELTNDDGTAREFFLRNLEAFLLTARRHGLPVQFTFFSFLPESFGAANPYLDPLAIQKQQNFIRTIAQRFKDVPSLSYDLINEPSFSKTTWKTRPNGDKLEHAAWNRWLHRRYPDWSALADGWNIPDPGPEAPLPDAEEFAPRGAYFGHSGLKVNDYYLFTQGAFADWTRKMLQTIRDSGSTQLVTVGQDDGGYQERLNPAFFADALDFTTNHTWWLDDDLLWCSLIAKQPGKPMLIQETGLQRQLTPREVARLTPESEAALLERKLAMSFAGGAGAVEWLWNINPYMTSDNEVTIGAIRADGTTKPDVAILRNIARFAHDSAPDLHDIERPQIAIVTSQALQYSPWNATANAAQQRAVRALFYHAHLAAYMVTENRIAADLGSPKLVILPSPQALGEPAWQSLLQYVRSGGHLLITGPAERDEHWLEMHRAAQLGLHTSLVPLTFHQTSVKIGDEKLPFTFGDSAQNNLETFLMEDRSNLQRTTVGKGTITWVASPIELSGDLESVGKVYAAAANDAGVAAAYAADKANEPSSGVLIYPQVMNDSVLYLFVSESSADEKIRLKDSATGARIELTLASQRAALALIRRSDGKLIARYGF